MSLNHPSEKRVSDVLDFANVIGELPSESTSMALQRNCESLRMTLLKAAWEDAGIDVEDPGELKQYYFPKAGFVVVDVHGGSR